MCESDITDACERNYRCLADMTDMAWNAGATLELGDDVWETKSDLCA
jgi:hypothetical protein